MIGLTSCKLYLLKGQDPDFNFVYPPSIHMDVPNFVMRYLWSPQVSLRYCAHTGEEDRTYVRGKSHQ